MLILLQKNVALAEEMELEPVLAARVLARVLTGKAHVLFARVQVQKNVIRAKAQDNDSPAIPFDASMRRRIEQ